MKGGIYGRPECCYNPCECPVCMENKLLKRLNCNHYICEDDINAILANRNPNLRVCPLCRVRITSYGCGNEIIDASRPTTGYYNIIDDEHSDSENNNEQNRNVNIISDDESDMEENNRRQNRNINIVSDDEDDYRGGKKLKKRKTNKRKNKPKKTNRVKRTKKTISKKYKKNFIYKKRQTRK